MASTFGRRLRDARLASGLSQSDLSEKIGIPKPTLSRYENDHVLPALPTFQKLAATLGVRESTLLHEAPDVYDRFIEALRKRGVTFSSTTEIEDIADAVVRARRQQRRSRRAS